MILMRILTERLFQSPSEGLTEQLLFIIINTDAAIACRLFPATGDVPYYSPHIKTERAATHF